MAFTHEDMGVLSWAVSGGCEPYRGTITAQYASPTDRKTYQISGGAGLLAVALPVTCVPSTSAQYTLSLNDASGQQTHSTVALTLNRACTTATPSSTPTPTRPSAELTGLQADYPTSLDMGATEWISLVFIGAPPRLPTEAPGRARALATPAIIGGTPGPVSATFGPGYRMFGVARLTVTGFDKELNGAEERPLDQLPIEWRWNISPKERNEGVQVVDLSAEILWKDAKDTVIVRQEIWHDTVRINVRRPLFPRGQSFLAAMATILGGALLSLHAEVWQLGHGLMGMLRPLLLRRPS